MLDYGSGRIDIVRTRPEINAVSRENPDSGIRMRGVSIMNSARPLALLLVFVSGASLAAESGAGAVERLLDIFPPKFEK